MQRLVEAGLTRGRLRTILIARIMFGCLIPTTNVASITMDGDWPPAEPIHVLVGDTFSPPRQLCFLPRRAKHGRSWTLR
jgi:hypothetical protein